MAEKTKTIELPVYTIPLQNSTLLVPGATIAEIIPYEPLQRLEEAAVWFLGLLSWRGVQVPVISFEMLTQQRVSFSLVSVASASLVVCRGIVGLRKVPYYAVVAQALPDLIRVTSEQLIATGEEAAKTELMRVLLKGESASIPNLAHMEREIRNLPL